MRKFLLFFIFILLSASLYASEAHGVHGVDKRMLWDFVWRVINFGILVFFLFKILKKPLSQFLYSRKEQVEVALKEAEEARLKAEQKYKEYEEMIKNLEKEKAEIIERMKKEAEAEKQRILKEAEEKAKKIIEQAKVLAQQEFEKEKEMLKVQATEKVINLATELLKRNITKDDHQKLIKETIERMVS